MAETDKIPVTWRPTGGLDFSRSELQRNERGVATATNMLFQKGIAHTRPLAFSGHLPVAVPSGVLLEYFKAFEVGDQGSVLVDVFIGNDANLYNNVPNGAEITGVNPTFLPRQFHNAELVNGVVLIANSVGGLIRWDYVAGMTASLIAAAPYLYVTSHISRAVAAFDISGGGVATPADCRTVAWSVAGDETDWTGAGSGLSVLSDMPSYIMGIQNIRNVLVIPHKTGFHLGYPTGIGTSAFRFESHTRVGTGLAQPAAICAHDNILYFLGTGGNVYRFDLSTAEPIGDEVRPAIMRAMKNGVHFKMFFTTNAGTNGAHDAKRLLHLVPITLALLPLAGHSTDEGYHYVLDLDEQKWSQHRYGVGTFRSAGCYVSQVTSGVPIENVVLGNFSEPAAGANTTRWVSGVYSIAGDAAQDAPSVLEMDERIIQEDPGNDYTLHDLLLVWALEEQEYASGAPYPNPEFSDTPPITVKIRYRESYMDKIQQQQIHTTEISDSSHGWYRSWVNLRVTGQFFQPIVEAPRGIRIKVDRAVGYFTPAGKSKAGLTN